MNNKNIEKAFINMIKGLEETSRKIEQKQDLKLWSEIQVPLTLENALSRLSKEELSTIRQKLEIAGASSLKKGELIQLFLTEIPCSLKKICSRMDQEQFNLLKKIIGQGGYTAAPNLEKHQFKFFRDYGIMFTGSFEGEKVVVVPEELVNLPFFKEDNKELTKICRRNTEWINLTHGLLYYYGTLNNKDLVNLLEKYTEESVDFFDYLRVMDQAASYYKQYRMELGRFSQIKVIDPDNIIREHQMRKSLEFFPFTKEQLLRAGEPGYIERNESYQQFVRFLIGHYDMRKKDADSIAAECMFAANNGKGPNVILQFLQTRLEFPNLETVKTCMDHVVALMNNMRQWFLKGYVPNELFQQERKVLQPLPVLKNALAPQKRIGRNAPCPCGSNKKYKNCCGK